MANNAMLSSIKTKKRLNTIADSSQGHNKRSKASSNLANSPLSFHVLKSYLSKGQELCIPGVVQQLCQMSAKAAGQDLEKSPFSEKCVHLDIN